MKKRNFKKLFAVVLTGAFALQTALVPVMAEESVSEDAELVEEIVDLSGLSMEDMGALGAVTLDIDASGSISMGGTELFDIDADITLAADASTGQHSASGSVGSNGISVNFAEYMDTEKIQVKLPGLAQVLSYNFQEDPSGSFLASVVGEDTLKVLNNALQLMSSAYSNPEAMAEVGQQIAEIITGAIGNLEFEQAPEKECSVGGEMVTCQGVQATISKELIMDIVSQIMEVSLPIGITYEEYFDGILAMSAQTDPSMPSSVTDVVGAYLEELPDEFLYAMYMTDAGTPAEFDLTVEDTMGPSTLALEFRGPVEMFWSEIALTVDGNEVMLLTTDFDGTAFTAALTVSGQEMGTFSLNLEDMSFEIASPMLPFEITGQVIMNEDGTVTVIVNIDALTITITMSYGGTVEELDGEVLDLSTMTEEDFNSIAMSLSSIFGPAAA